MNHENNEENNEEQSLQGPENADLEKQLTETSKLNKDVNPKFLLKFALPTILSMIIMSTMGIIDGVFISRLIDESAFAAVSIAMPFLMFALAIGFMLGVGGNAIVAKILGEGNVARARNIFSFITLTAFIVSIIMTSTGIFFPSLVLDILGADVLGDQVLEYLRPIIFALPIVVGSVIFQQFLMTEGKAHISTISFLISGVINIGLNFLLVGHFDMGLQGAAIATSVGYSLPAVIGLVYFLRNKKGKLYFVKPTFDAKVLIDSAINGSSEFITMMAASIVSAITNRILMDMGETFPIIPGYEYFNTGSLYVATVGVSFALMGILSSIFIGYASGILPIISFNFGKGDHGRLKSTFKISVFVIVASSLLSIGLAFIFSSPLVRIYFNNTDQYTLYAMTIETFRIVSLSFVFMGINAFGSMFFTALSNGKLSALIAVSRTFIFAIIALFTLPAIFETLGMQRQFGVYAAMPAAEVATIFVTVILFKIMAKRYKYA